MIGLVLVTHGNLANEFISAMQHVVGKQEQVAPVCIGPEDDMEMRRAEILKKVEDVNDGSGVVVLTDMFGGTPSNLAISIMDRAKVEIIAGVNLPMLIKLASLRKDKNLKETVEGAQEAGKKYISDKSANSVDYKTLVTEKYLEPVQPVAGERYDGIKIESGGGKIEVVTAKGSEVTKVY